MMLLLLEHQRPDLQRDLVVWQRLSYWQTAAAAAQDVSLAPGGSKLVATAHLAACGHWEGLAAVICEFVQFARAFFQDTILTINILSLLDNDHMQPTISKCK